MLAGDGEGCRQETDLRGGAGNAAGLTEFLKFWHAFWHVVSQSRESTLYRSCDRLVAILVGLLPELVLGLEPQHTLKDLVLCGVALDEVLMHSGRGFDVLPGSSSSDWMQALTSAQFHQLTASLRQLDSYDFLLIDTAITAAHNALSFAQTSPEVILVITPLPISVPDAYSLLNLLFSEYPRKRIQVVVNKTNNHIVY